MKILSNTSVETTINGINISTLNGQVSTNTTNISNKANLSELAVGNVNGDDYGRLISINFDTDTNITEFNFNGGIVSIAATIII